MCLQMQTTAPEENRGDWIYQDTLITALALRLVNCYGSSIIKPETRQDSLKSSM